MSTESKAVAQASLKASNDELQIHFNNGLPSVVLAFVTIVLSIYSYFLVQPNIQKRYREICTTNLKKMDVATTEEKLRLLSDTQLALRRLTMIDNGNDAIRFELAKVSEAIADWYRIEAYESATKDPQTNEAGNYLAGMQNELRKATDTMRSIQRLNGDDAIQATAWLLKNRLHDSYSLSDKELLELESQINQALINSPEKSDAAPSETNKSSGRSEELIDPNVIKATSPIDNESPAKPGQQDLKWILGEILGTRALKFSDVETQIQVQPESPAKAITASDRLQLLREASSSLNVSDSENLVTESWRSLVLLSLEPDKAKELAWGAVQDFWARGTPKHPRSEELDAVVRGLLVGGNLEEAQSFIMNQIKRLPSFELPKFRRLVAESCLRQIVADYLIDQQSRDEKSAPALQTKASLDRMMMDYKLLELSVRLQPELDAYSNVLIAIGKADSNEIDRETDDSLSGYVRRVIATRNDEGFNGIIVAVKAFKDGDRNTLRKAIEQVCSGDIAFSVLATQVAMSLDNNEANRNLVIFWLKAINEFSPDALSAWFARGKLHLNTSEKEQAIECFEYLVKRLPDNEQVKELLDEARQ